MKPSLQTSQTVTQRQIITQKQLQSLNILQMTGEELESFLQNEHLENPMLEYSGTSGQSGNVSWNDVTHSDLISQLPQAQDDFRDLLRTQLHTRHLTKEENRIMRYLIDSVEDTGYFLQTVSEVSRDINAPESLVERCLQILKQMEPAGVFSRDLSECLLKQLEVLGIDDYELTEMVRFYLEDVAANSIGRISRALKISTAQVRKYILLITSLSPRPAEGYGKGKVEYRIPDIVVRFDDETEIHLNDKWMNDYRVNDYYLKLMQETRDPELKAYFEKQLRRTRYVMEHIEERRKTLTELTGILVEEQQAYVKGTGPLKPFTMQDAAMRMGIHPSTVSRAVKGKLIQLPDRVVEMRTLFSQTATKTGDLNADAIKEKINALIREEDPSHPLSDQALTDSLRSRGINISRRAVAKYRESMGIKGSFDRRQPH